MDADDLEAILLYMNRVTKVLERIAERLNENSDGYDYDELCLLSDVECYRKGGWELCKVAAVSNPDAPHPFYYLMRRPRGYEDAQTAAESDANEAERANDEATWYEYQDDIPF